MNAISKFRENTVEKILLNKFIFKNKIFLIFNYF